MTFRAIIFILTIITSLHANAQLYPIVSLDGGRQQIRLRYEYVDRNLKIFYKKDTFTIHEVDNIEKIYYLSPQILAIECGKRAGSGMHVKLTQLLCIKNYRLIPALNQITQDIHYNFNDKTQKSYIDYYYVARLKLAGSIKQRNARLLFIQKHRKDSLFFNDALGCFYNGYKSFDTIQPVLINDSTTKHIYFKGTFPATRIDDFVEIFTNNGYYFWMDSIWYRRNDFL